LRDLGDSGKRKGEKRKGLPLVTFRKNRIGITISDEPYSEGGSHLKESGEAGMETMILFLWA
jgi:hypothetical protein